MKAALVLCLTASAAHADPLADVVRAQLLPSLPAGTDVAAVHLPAAFAKLDVDPAAVTVELPRALAVGRPSIKLAIRGKRPVFVPIAIAPLVEVAVTRRALAAGAQIATDDVAIELRAVEGAVPVSVIGATVRHPIDAGAIVTASAVALPPPVPRGTQVTVELRRGGVRVRGAGTLELAARPGEPATVRLAHTRAIVRGTFIAPATVRVGGLP